MLDHIAMPASDSPSSRLAKGQWEANHIHVAFTAQTRLKRRR